MLLEAVGMCTDNLCAKITNTVFLKPGPEVIIFFFMLNSAEHEICPANKSQITNFFLAKHS